ncbi:DNA directed RNA polymerase [Limtongia smithiae]|uniref:DNA directed RNA polymerase n=1 Tax=Limtongia smithiae TaxID=1125753 RepID=UPI0034CD5B0A
MNREAFVPPTVQNSSSAAAVAGRAFQPTQAITYLCANCAAKNTLNRNDPVRCRECGHRVLYKQRTRRMVQFEAR